jgi:tRNA (guanine37-N1)-methyltransferase
VRIDLLTLFPEMVRPPLEHSILGRANSAGHLEFGVHNLRDHGLGRHRVVDDTPYGGGSGMVMRVDVVAAALEPLRTADSRVILTAPAGHRFDQGHARRLSACSHLIFICGHYEGVDGRVAQYLADEVLSIGDYVLTGGELAALVMVDAISRLLPGVLGNAESLAEESFCRPRLEAHAFTRPPVWRGHEVPEVLRSGHHARIREWREATSLELTQKFRPDLLDLEPPPPPIVDKKRPRP